MPDDFQVDTWGEPPVTARGRGSKYTARMEVVRARHKLSPDEWAVVARFEGEGSTRHRAAMLRKDFPKFVVVTSFNEKLDPPMWEVWAKYDPKGEAL